MYIYLKNTLKRITYICLYFVLHTIVSISSELPPIVKFSPSQYNAGNQNWMITQDNKNFMFFANNNGLLEYNGSEWTTYTSPNETIIRSVKAVDDKIYTGCYMEFGYWKRKADNSLKYYSLSQKIKSKILDDEQFWNILNYENWIIFQSLNQIFIYNTEKDNFRIVTPKKSITKAFLANETFYFQVYNEGLYEVNNGNSKLVCSIIRPIKELRDFKMVELNPNETKIITFKVNKETLGFYNNNLEWIVEPGEFNLFIGESSDKTLQTKFSYE